MHDYNFFAVYLDEKRKRKKRMTIITCSLVAFLLVVGGVFGYNYIRISTMEKEIGSIEAYLNSSDVIDDNIRVGEKRKGLLKMREYKDLVVEVNSDLSNAYLTYTTVFDDITYSTVDDLYLSRLEISREGMTMEGYAKDRTSIAYFQRRLKEKSQIKDVLISSIKSKENEGNTFEMVCKFEDVIDNEGN